MSLKILVGADVASPAANTEKFKITAAGWMEGQLRAAWESADARLFSLDCTLSDCVGEPARSQESAPVCAQGIQRLKPVAVSLFCRNAPCGGEEELRRTLAVLKTAGIPYFGAGSDLDEAVKPYYFAKNNLRVGVYAVGEHAGCAATERSAGINPIDLVELGDRIRELRGSCDRLIVFYRGGNEAYPYPSPEAQKICRKIAECGASLVLSRQGDLTGCYEKWDNATIVYGLGAFLSETGETLAEGILVQYEIGDYGTEHVSFLPIEASADGALLAGEERATQILEAFETRSRRIRVQGFVEARFRAYAAANRDRIVHVLAGGGSGRRAVDALMGKHASDGYTKQDIQALLGALESESARELLAEGLRHEAV
ncbi:MAG: CapA family protein [Clostridiaceae bacterium]